MTRLDWPDKSSYLNPNENLWKIVENNVTDKQPSSPESLKETMSGQKTFQFSTVTTSFSACSGALNAMLAM